MTNLPVERAISRVRTPEVPEHLKEQAKVKIHELMHCAAKEFGADMPMPTCSFDLRGRVAGKALLGRMPVKSKDKVIGKTEPLFHVQFNAVLFMENVQLFLDDTIPHEVAHLVADALYGRRIAPHGHEWQSVMHLFGSDPCALHNMDVTNARVHRLFEHACGCKTYNLTSRRFKQALTGRLRCSLCKQPLFYTGRVKPPGEPWQETTLQELGVPSYVIAGLEIAESLLERKRA